MLLNNFTFKNPQLYTYKSLTCHFFLIPHNTHTYVCMCVRMHAFYPKVEKVNISAILHYFAYQNLVVETKRRGKTFKKLKVFLHLRSVTETKK